MSTGKTLRLDARNVKKLPPGEYRDATVPGLLFRVTPTSRAWAMRPTFGGQRPRLDLGPLAAVDEKQARTLARKLIGGVPLSTQARAVVGRQLATIGRRETYLFPKVVKSNNPALQHAKINNRFVQLLRDGVSGKDWHIHDLRRTLSTHVENQFGVDIRVISLILGHVPEGVPKATRIYALGQRLDDRRTALQQWADWLESLPKKWPKDGPHAAITTKASKAFRTTESRKKAA